MVTFVKLNFDSGTIYLHDSIGTFIWSDPVDGSQNWLGVGDFGGISTVQESTQMSGFEITLVLSGLDAGLMNAVMLQDFQGRGVTSYLGALDIETGLLLDTPNEIWSGEMDVARLSLGAADQNAIEIICESDFSKLDDINGRTFSDSDLQAEFTGDTFLQYMTAMEDTNVVWRGSTQIRYDKSPRPPFDPRDIPSFF
jgi:hypothetical protein